MVSPWYTDNDKCCKVLERIAKKTPYSELHDKLDRTLEKLFVKQRNYLKEH